MNVQIINKPIIIQPSELEFQAVVDQKLKSYFPLTSVEGGYTENIQFLSIDDLELQSKSVKDISAKKIEYLSVRKNMSDDFKKDKNSKRNWKLVLLAGVIHVAAALVLLGVLGGSITNPMLFVVLGLAAFGLLLTFAGAFNSVNLKVSLERKNYYAPYANFFQSYHLLHPARTENLEKYKEIEKANWQRIVLWYVNIYPQLKQHQKRILFTEELPPLPQDMTKEQLYEYAIANEKLYAFYRSLLSSIQAVEIAKKVINPRQQQAHKDIAEHVLLPYLL